MTFKARLAAPSAVSDHLYLVGYNGNQLAWNGTSLTVPSGWSVSISAAGLAPNTVYYVYVYDDDGDPALELSTVGHQPGVAGYEIKQADESRLLAGMVCTDEDGLFVRDTRRALIINWHNRLRIFAAAPAAGISTVCQYPDWAELGTASDNLIDILTWGYQLGIAECVDMGISGIAKSNIGGGRVDMVFGTQDRGPTLPVSSWITMTSATAHQFQNVSGSSTMGLPEGKHTVSFWGRAHGGGTAQVYVNTFASTNG